jgi:AraC-like DNA-binding protein
VVQHAFLSKERHPQALFRHPITKPVVKGRLLSRDVGSEIEEFDPWIRADVRNHLSCVRRHQNQRCGMRCQSRDHAQCRYTIYYPVVRRWSTIRVAHRTYSVPAQLIGHTVEARVHPNVVEVRYRDQVVQTMPRLRKEDEHRTQGITLAQAAAEVGYESEAAFNRAFKKYVGMPPGTWRKWRQNADGI